MRKLCRICLKSGKALGKPEQFMAGGEGAGRWKARKCGEGVKLRGEKGIEMT